MTTTVEQIQQLMQELGPSLPDIDAVVQTEEPSWAVQFSDETVLIIEPSEDPARMIFSAELGSATDDLQLPIYETLLCYNLMWRETGGVKIGLAGPKGALIVSSELCLEGLTLMNLQEAINNFANIARSWSKYVIGDIQTSPGLPGLESGSMHLQA
jgi:hypothetical protein